MKYRTGLVSNSSSSSFIVMMHSRPPMTVKEKEEWLQKYYGDDWKDQLGDRRYKQIMEDDSIYLAATEIEYWDEGGIVFNDLGAKDYFLGYE